MVCISLGDGGPTGRLEVGCRMSKQVPQQNLGPSDMLLAAQ